MLPKDKHYFRSDLGGLKHVIRVLGLVLGLFKRALVNLRGRPKKGPYVQTGTGAISFSIFAENAKYDYTP